MQSEKSGFSARQFYREAIAAKQVWPRWVSVSQT
jgi:hypothetical protein